MAFPLFSIIADYENQGESLNLKQKRFLKHF